MYLMKGMKYVVFAPIAFILAFFCSCAQKPTAILDVREVPLKQIQRPADNTGMHRIQSNYLLYGAVSREDRKNRLGQYYFVTWQDSDPEKELSLVMQYRQGKSGSKILSKSVHYPSGRSAGEKTPVFEFIGDEVKNHGKVLSWRIQLQDAKGTTISSRQSFLWSDKN